MRLFRAIALTLCLGWTVGCGNGPTQVAEATVVDLWLPVVIATPPEIEAIADATRDPYFGSLLGGLSPEDHALASEALQEFELGLADAPGPSFVALEQRLAPLEEDKSQRADPDAQVVHGALEIYRDWSAKTLFGVDRKDLAPLGPRSP